MSVMPSKSDGKGVMMASRGLDTPLVSVVIPAYMAAETIERAVRSMTAQDYENLEILVIDDCSPDNTAAIVESIGDPRIRVIRAPFNTGESSVNYGIEAATGKYVAFLDADDESLPERISKQVSLIEQDPSMSLVACGFTEIWISATGEKLSQSDAPCSVSGPEAWRTALREACILKSGVLARTSLLKNLGGFDRDLPVAGDQDMWIRLALAGQVGRIQEPMVLKYDVPSSLMKRYPRGEYDFLIPMIRRHLEANRNRLSKAEYNSILGERLEASARNLARGGHYLLSVRLLLDALKIDPWRALRIGYAIVRVAVLRFIKQLFRMF